MSRECRASACLDHEQIFAWSLGQAEELKFGTILILNLKSCLSVEEIRCRRGCQEVTPDTPSGSASTAKEVNFKSYCTVQYIQYSHAPSTAQ